MARLTNQQLLESVPVGFKGTLPNGDIIERRKDDVYLNGKPLRGPFYGCETVKDFQRRAAEMTNAHRKASTAARIKTAQALLLAEGGKATVARLAKMARVSRQAIYAYHRDLIEKNRHLAYSKKVSTTVG